MKEIKLPWDEEEKAIKYAYVNPRNSFSEKYAYVITIGLIILAIFTRFKLTLILALLLLLSLLSKKYVAATQRGLEMLTDMKFRKTHEIWNWSDIDAITYESKADHPELILLYFTKNDITKRFFFHKEDKEKVFDIAHAANKKIKLFDAYEYKENLKYAKKKLKQTKRSWN